MSFFSYLWKYDMWLWVVPIFNLLIASHLHFTLLVFRHDISCLLLFPAAHVLDTQHPSAPTYTKCQTEPSKLCSIECVFMISPHKQKKKKKKLPQKQKHVKVPGSQWGRSEGRQEGLRNDQNVYGFHSEVFARDGLYMNCRNPLVASP